MIACEWSKLRQYFDSMVVCMWVIKQIKVTNNTSLSDASGARTGPVNVMLCKRLHMKDDRVVVCIFGKVA